MQLVIFAFFLSLVSRGVAYQKPFLFSFYGTHVAQERHAPSNRAVTSRLSDYDNGFNKHPTKSSSERLQKIAQLRNFTQHDANKVLNSMMRNMDQVELKQVCSLLQNNLDVQAANRFVPDHISMSTAIARCARLSMYVEAIELFEALQTHKIPFDMITLRSAIRAAANIRQWSYTLELLEMSYREFGASTIELVAIALESLKFITSLRETPRYIIGADVMSKMQQLLSWMYQHKLTPSLAVKESSLLLYCQYGSDQECDLAFAQLSSSSPPSLKACGMMLDRAARQGDEPRARSLLQTMQQYNLQLDQVMYNMLLKLCAVKGDTIWAQEVLELLRGSGGYVDDYAATSLVKLGLLRPQQPQSRFNSNNNNNKPAFLLPVTGASSFAYSTAITQLIPSSSPSTASTIVQLLHEAEQRNCVDYAVYIAAATAQVQQDDINAAMTTIRRLLTHNPQLLTTGHNPVKQTLITISFVIDHLLPQEEESTGYQLLIDLLHTIAQSHPVAVQQAIEATLPRLITKQQPLVVISLLQRFAANYLLPRRLLDSLLISFQVDDIKSLFMQDKTEMKEYQPESQEGSHLLLSFLLQQCSLFAQTSPSPSPSLPPSSTTTSRTRLPIGTKVMESVVQTMITERDAATMIASTIADDQPLYDLFNLLRGQTIPSLAWRPTGKILFLFSRFFLLVNDVDNVGELLLTYSGSFSKPLLPATLVSTAVSALYAAGRKAMALDLFALYAGNKVDRIRQTWSNHDQNDNDNEFEFQTTIDDDEEDEDVNELVQQTSTGERVKRGLLLDLHYQSRGMAYVLLLTSLEQVIRITFCHNILF